MFYLLNIFDFQDFRVHEMAAEQDPLWYDREEADEPLEPVSLVMSLAIIALERIVFFPVRLWRDLKLGTIAAFKDVTDTRR